MKNNQSISIIQKLIRLTKDHSIFWTKYPLSNIELKPLPKSPLELNLATQVALNTFRLSKFSPDESYVTTFQGGSFFLLLYHTLAISGDLELRIQTENSSNSQTYASTSTDDDDNLKVASLLKRLYNLVDASNLTEDIDSFVAGFIKNE